MKKLNRIVLPTAVLFFFAGVLAVVGLTSGAGAQELLQDNQDQNQEQTEDEEQSNEEVQEQESTENSQDATEAYTYVAQPGDSYTLMARKAIQTYGLDKEINLSQAQIIFAETNLALAAGSPRLNTGQEVQIEESLTQEWVEKAQQLSEDDQAAWAAYVAGVNFNTDAVGEES